MHSKILPIISREISVSVMSRMLMIAAVIIVFVTPARSQLIIDVDNPGLSKMPIAVADFSAVGSSPISGKDLSAIIKNDLVLTGLFKIIEPTGPIPSDPRSDQDFEAWIQAGAQALITGTFEVRGQEIIIDAKLYDSALKKMELGRRFTAALDQHRHIIHKFADRVMEKLTKIPGCFSTQIAFAGDSPTKELFMMDFDGHGLRQLTNTGSINLSPDWAPDCRSMVFTSYANHNPDLWFLDLSSLNRYPISTRPGINASGRFSPDGSRIALSMSFKGTPKIFIITMQGNIIKQLTSGRGNDISPSWSPDGSSIAYVSDQAGAPQIYIAPVSGGEPKRLTLGNSNYNTDPDWSPAGNILTFTARIDGRFQICTIKTDGSDFRVLTGTGSNQDPAWSPDGRMITFTSTRDGRNVIYIMDARGQIQVPVSRVSGKTPAWSRRSW